MKSLSIIAALGLSLLAGGSLAAQKSYNPLHSAATSLRISPDARGAALGDQGVSTAPDAFAQYWNPAKYSFADSRAGIGLSYTPWLRQVSKDIALMQVVGYYQLDKAAKHSLGGSLRYLSIGSVESWDELGNSLGSVKPNEFALDLSYSYKLSPSISLATALRFVSSQQDIAGGSGANTALVFDLAAYAQRPLQLLGRQGQWRAGIALSNLGSKLTISNGNSQYLPAKMALGAGLSLKLDEANALSLDLQVAKHLMPAYPRLNSYDTPEAYAEALKRYNSTSAWSGIFYSFHDAPGGFAEEMKELHWSLGAEYSLRDRFFLRAGYSLLSPDKGSLQGFTAGAGLKLNAFKLDASYFVSSTAQNPLDQTLRLSLGIDMDALVKLF